MNQDQFLEQLWSDVIEDPSGRIEARERAGSAARVPVSLQEDLRRVSRHARYGAVFDWCVAFDEAGLPPAAWLAPKSRKRWERLIDEGPGAVLPDEPTGPPAPDAPFAEADEALDRLSLAGVPRDDIRDAIRRSRRAALHGVLLALRGHDFGPDDLAGLHESLLTADPSGLEGRSGPRHADSDPRAIEARVPSASAPLLKVRRSHDLAFSPDGSRIVAATGGAVTEIGSGRVLATCRLLANTSHVAWSPDGRWIAGTSTSGKIALCDAATGARRHILEMTHEGAGALFSPDGSTVYGGDWDGLLFAWNVLSGREIRRTQLAGSMVRSIRWVRGRDALDVVACQKPEPDYLVTLGATLGAVERRIDLPTGTEDVVWDPQCRTLVVGYEWIARMDSAGCVIERREVAGARALETSPDGRWYALAHGSGFRIGPTEDLAPGVERAMRYASNATFSADSRRVALATWNAGEVWEIDRLASSVAARNRG